MRVHSYRCTGHARQNEDRAQSRSRQRIAVRRRQSKVRKRTRNSQILKSRTHFVYSVRPEDLVVPYDPAFIPDFTLPILDLDLLNPFGTTVSDPKLNSSLVSSNFSVSPHSQLDMAILPQLDVDSPSNNTLVEFGGFSFGSGSVHSAQERNNIFGAPETRAEEEGVLLQPDFEFDEEGNIIDLLMTDAPAMQVETPVRGRVSRGASREITEGQQVSQLINF